MRTTRTAVFLLPLALAACGDDDPVGIGDSAAAADVPTWHQDIRPLLHERCNSCHSADGLAATLPWTSYDVTKSWAPSIAHQVEARTMPPFLAQDTDDCTHRFPFVHDTRLTDDEIARFRAWSDAGMPLGNEATATPLPPPIELHLTDYDEEIVPTHGFTVPPGGDYAICWSLKPNIETMKWLEALEVVPGDGRVTHHINVQVHDDPTIDARIDPELGYWECEGGSLGGTDFAGWLPGSLPVEMPEDVAIPIGPDSRITVNIHYHNLTGEPVDDLTRIRVRYGKEGGTYLRPGMFRVGRPGTPGADDFVIPPGASSYIVEDVMTVPGPPGSAHYVFMLSNHMHTVGRDMRMWVEHAAGTKAADEPDDECLLATPDFDTTWQAFYYHDVLTGQAPIVRQGDKIRVRCVFDNSTGNEAWMDALEAEGLPREPIPVAMGESFLDEMCTGLLGTIEKNAMDAVAARAAGAGAGR